MPQNFPGDSAEYPVTIQAPADGDTSNAASVATGLAQLADRTANLNARLVSGGGGGGAPTDATYVVLSTSAGLTGERTLAVGAGLTLTDAGAGLAATIAPAFGTTTGTTAQGDDSRFTNARTPTAHAASHQHGGSDEVATATAGANAIPKAGAGGTLATGWLPAATTGARGVVQLDALGDTTKFLNGNGAFTVPAGGGSGVLAIYADAASLPSAAANSGKLAFVSDIQSLYLSDGTSWGRTAGLASLASLATATGGVRSSFQRVDATAGNVTLAVPADGVVENWILFSRLDASSNTVTLQRTGTDTIDGATSITLAPGEVRIIASNGSGAWTTSLRGRASGPGAFAVAMSINGFGGF